MSYVSKTISEVVAEYLNRTTFLPAIQREFVWDTRSIEKLFDSIMGEYPISSMLFWKIREESKNDWVAYEFIRDFDQENPHNTEANLAGVNNDIYLVLDGQQRLTSLYISLKGSYRYFYYRHYNTRLYLNLLKEPVEPENPEDLIYQFQFRENASPNLKDNSPQLWFLVGDILDYSDAEDAKDFIKPRIESLPEKQKTLANSLIGKLHSRIHTQRVINYYEEKTKSYDKVVEIFIRANTGGVKLAYSDILLSTATAKWQKVNAREEINAFTDYLNTIGTGYSFDKDFVMKGCLYLTEGLPIQYKVKNFTRSNLALIENNWEMIKETLESTVRLIAKFGYNSKNLSANLALLPITLYIKKISRKDFVQSTAQHDVKNQLIIQKWLAVALLKNAFGSSSDTTLKNLQDVIQTETDLSTFPYKSMNQKLGIEMSFSDAEIENLLSANYSTKYSYLILSLLYPDRDWKSDTFHEDHIFPKSSFTEAKLRLRGFQIDLISEYQRQYNAICNLQLLTSSENQKKSAEEFETWINTRDDNFKTRHTIPEGNYSFDNFIEFIKLRKSLISKKLQSISTI